MKRWLLILLLACAWALAPLVLTTCGSAGVPAPPVETPSPIVLKFVEPEALRIDLSTISATSASISKLVPLGGDYSQQIIESAITGNSFIDGFLSPALAGIGKVEVPVSETMTAYHDTVDFGTHTVLKGVKDVKISFADFDFDNDGMTEGCKGHTAALPICGRMWIDDERYLAWVFETYPYFDDPATPADESAMPGRGRMKTFVEEITELFIGGQFLSRMDYDFFDPEFLESNGRWQIFFPDDGSSLGNRVRVTQEGPDATAVKLIESWGGLDEDGYANPAVVWEVEGWLLARYRENFDPGYWSGTITGDITNQCAIISTGDGTAESDCADVGGIDIRVGGLPFLDPLNPADVAVPKDFPLNPPAGMFP